MSVWFCCPSKRPLADVGVLLDKWRARGYQIKIWRDECATTPYAGYAATQNLLVAAILREDPQADWIVCAADDIEPDPEHNADVIAAQCAEHFAGTFGVMQPTGDRWGDGNGAYIDRVAGSPWIGRSFAERTYNGNGPYWPEYRHMFVDQELQDVAIKLGVFWQRPDLQHYHRHWGRPLPGERYGERSRMPAFLAEANSPEHWRKYQALYEQRKAAGFPGHEPLVEVVL